MEEEKKETKIELLETKSDKCSTILIILSFIVTIAPSVACVVFSILSYDNEYKIYFNLMFIFQGIHILIVIITAIFLLTGCECCDCSSSRNSRRGHEHVYIDPLSLILSCVLFLGGLIFLGLGITVLVFFIKYFSNLEFLAKVGNFIYLSFFLIAYILTLVIRAWKKELNKDGQNDNYNHFSKAVI